MSLMSGSSTATTGRPSAIATASRSFDRNDPIAALERARDAVRALMAADPVELDIGLGQVKVVAADSRTLAPPLYVSGIPADEETLRALMS
jgi:hypothetical protein